MSEIIPLYMIKVERFDAATGFEIVDSVIVERLGEDRLDVIDVAISHYQKVGAGERTRIEGTVIKGVRTQDDALAILRRFLNEKTTRREETEAPAQ